MTKYIKFLKRWQTYTRLPLKDNQCDEQKEREHTNAKDMQVEHCEGEDEKENKIQKNN